MNPAIPNILLAAAVFMLALARFLPNATAVRVLDAAALAFAGFALVAALVAAHS